MNALHEYRTTDKSQWGDGAWQGEPDKVQWIDAATSLDCLLVRNRLGAWCGYVGVPETHPYFGVDYDGVDADVHGGLTFAGLCQEGAEKDGICHIPIAGRPDKVWWLGFDCAHAGDLTPGSDSRLPPHLYAPIPGYPEVYRDMPYVVAEVENLALQIHAVSGGAPTEESKP